MEIEIIIIHRTIIIYLREKKTLNFVWRMKNLKVVQMAYELLNGNKKMFILPYAVC